MPEPALSGIRGLSRGRISIMSGRWRVWRVAKWAGLGVCCLILTAWGLVVDFVGGCDRCIEYLGSNNYVILTPGVVVWWWGDVVDPTAALGWRIRRFGSIPLPWRQRFGLALPFTSSRGPGKLVVSIPLWTLLCLVGAPTALMFWLDHHRRPKPGHCRTCGYNLTGNESGICSECGCKIGQEE